MNFSAYYGFYELLLKIILGMKVKKICNYICIHFLGLFHKAIMQSGTCMNPWASQRTPKKYALQLCEALGRKITNSREIVEFLRTIDCQKLIEEQDKLLTTEVQNFR